METVLLFILGIVIFIAGLVVSVALHELGHLTFAKIFGVKVSQYMVGFGKTIWSIKRGETEYGIKPILLGGYISMAGMFPPLKATETSDTALGSQAASEAALPEESRAAKTRRNLFGTLVQDAREASATTIGDTDPKRAFYNAAPWKRLIIMFAGPFMNLLIAAGIAAIMICGFGQATPSVGTVSSCLPATPTASCVSADAASPASTAGLKAKDVIESVNGKTIQSPDQITAVLQRSLGKTVHLGVLRAHKHLTIDVTPAAAERQKVDATGQLLTTSAGKPLTGTVGSIGVSLGFTLVPQNALAIVPSVWQETGATYQLIGNLPSGLVGVWNSTVDHTQRSTSGPISIVGVGRAVGDVASVTGAPVSDRVYTILGLLESLNIALFVMNLLPLLPLDGGHMVGALWEMIKRGYARIAKRPRPAPVDLARAMPLTVVVVSVLVIMSAFLIFADLVNPISIT
ncbi:MAG TPA: site-2 protease family protein [Galbitalea sp.]